MSSRVVISVSCSKIQRENLSNPYAERTKKNQKTEIKNEKMNFIAKFKHEMEFSRNGFILMLHFYKFIRLLRTRY